MTPREVEDNRLDVAALRARLKEAREVCTAGGLVLWMMPDHTARELIVGQIDASLGYLDLLEQNRRQVEEASVEDLLAMLRQKGADVHSVPESYGTSIFGPARVAIIYGLRAASGGES